jgi:hypothetical protein
MNVTSTALIYELIAREIAGQKVIVIQPACPAKVCITMPMASPFFPTLKR